MNTLSRREEDALFKATKERALKECDPIVKEFADCASGRSISLAWACRTKWRSVQECMHKLTSPENMDLVRADYIRSRNQITAPSDVRLEHIE